MPYDLDARYGPAWRNYNAPPGGTATATTEKRKTRPQAEFLVGSTGFAANPGPRTLPNVPDDAALAYGPTIYDAMDTDPIVRSAKAALKLSIMAGGMDLAPAEKPDAGVKELTPEEQKAADMVDFCWRSVERLDDFEAVCFDLLEACRVGVKLAEATFELAATGEDAGKLVLASLRVKPNKLWDFRVDEYMSVVGIEARGTGAAPKVVYPPEKFLWLSWEPRDGDPRGTSIYRAAIEPWHNKVRTYPELYKNLVQFGSTSLIGKLGPQHVASEPLDAAGNPIAGAAPVTPETRMGQGLSHFRNGSYIVIGFEDDVIPIPPQGNGDAFHKAFDYFDRQIVQGMLLQTRATMEAQHGSKADSQTGQDMFGLLSEMGRKSLSACIRRLLRLLITLNFGEETAAGSTPLVTFGQSDPQDRASLWSAAASLGYQLGDSQIPEFDAMLGLPTRDMEEDEKKAQEKADKAFQQQQELAASRPAPAFGGKPGAKPTGKPKAGGKPADFAAEDYGTSLTGPWHDADIREARTILNRNLPSGAAVRRWEKGEVDASSSRALLDYVADECKALLTLAGADLTRELDFLDPRQAADFAASSVFEALTRFKEATAQTLRRYYLAGVLALSGPDAMDEPAWETLREENQAQLAYLDGFMGDVASGKQPRDGTLAARAGMYGQSVRVVAQAVEREKMIARGMTLERRVHVGDPADICGECKAEQAKGWQPIGTLKPIGDCLCKTGCHCHFEYKRGGR